MTPMEIDFYLKMLVVFIASGLIFAYMQRLQNKKQKEADVKFEFTMQLIEMRNRKYGESNESKK